MDRNRLAQILEAFKQGDVDLEQALKKLQTFPYADLEFARIDHHRSIRQGFPEVVFGPGKTKDQIIAIVSEMLSSGSNVLITRTGEDVFQALRERAPDITTYHKSARAITITNAPLPRKEGLIALVTAGTSDVPTAEEAAVTAELLGNPIKKFYDVGVAGLHRLLSIREDLTQARVIICVAGMEGALPSVVGGLVAAPVIAVPTSIGYGTSLGGITALLSMLNSCSANVAVVNIDNGFGAGMIANLINQ